LTALSSTSAGIAPPLSQEIGPYPVVTFRVRVGQTAQVATQVGAQDEAQVGTKHTRNNNCRIFGMRMLCYRHGY